MHTFLVPIHIRRDVQHRLKFAKVASASVPSFLRTRTVLAFLHHHDLLTVTNRCSEDRYYMWAPKAFSVEDRGRWWHEWEDYLQDDCHLSEGGIFVLHDTTAGWTDQCPVIILKNEYQPQDLLAAFEPSLRWLNDRSGIKRVLEGYWEIKSKESC